MIEVVQAVAFSEKYSSVPRPPESLSNDAAPSGLTVIAA
jgi:hypothetical protein